MPAARAAGAGHGVPTEEVTMLLGMFPAARRGEPDRRWRSCSSAPQRRSGRVTWRQRQPSGAATSQLTSSVHEVALSQALAPPSLAM